MMAMLCRTVCALLFTSWRRSSVVPSPGDREVLTQADGMAVDRNRCRFECLRRSMRMFFANLAGARWWLKIWVMAGANTQIGGEMSEREPADGQGGCREQGEI
ncbi:uncharacterized protein B0I36DRAFT_312953 [Microdochium trichocladiopsis]|uniref:Uncharacterized protein n=1 Tax=Microdochium trichocladiopsis TaxID=1682393 RepID=A0A9P8YKE1_9PEZI|nr:uncharacterized protein B0I36DRAFT_312953 [Microdochium trichocladiopsis]KAH7041508.1 hypothetical protein B0I36DRAFT_312953 [Microdochium trichocladiopsis]